MPRYYDKDITSGCPEFRTGWDSNKAVCQNCSRSFRLEYYSCRKAVLYRKFATVSDIELGEIDRQNTASNRGKDKPAIKAKRKPKRMERVAKLLRYGGYTTDEIVITVCTEFKVEKSSPVTCLRKEISAKIAFMRYAGCIYEDHERRLWVQPNMFQWCEKCRKHEGQFEMEFGRVYCMWCAEQAMKKEKK